MVVTRERAQVALVVFPVASVHGLCAGFGKDAVVTHEPEQRRPRPVRKILPGLHPQAMGTRPVRAFHVGRGAHTGAHERRRPLLCRCPSVHARRRLHGDVPPHAGPRAHQLRNGRSAGRRSKIAAVPASRLYRAHRRVLRLPLRPPSLSLGRVPARARSRACTMWRRSTIPTISSSRA